MPKLVKYPRRREGEGEESKEYLIARIPIRSLMRVERTFYRHLAGFWPLVLAIWARLILDCNGSLS